MNLWESYDRIDDYLKDKLLTIPPIAQEYIDKHPELIENYSKPELGSIYKRYNNPFY